MIGIVSGAIVFFSAGLVSAKIFSRKIEKIGVTGRYNTDTMPDYILGEISGGLTKINESKYPEPSIASSWQTPDKGKTWIFTIAEDAIWQDGKKVVSEDISYNFSNVEVERIDEKTISFSLKDPFVAFPSVVSKPIFKKGLLGTGDWKVDGVSLVAGNISKLTIVNDKGNKKIYKFYPTTDRTVLAFKLGEIDQISRASSPVPFDKWGNVRIEEIDNFEQTVTIFFSARDADLFEKSLRQSLAYAIDKKSFNAIRSLSSISPNSWAYNPQVKTYDYDVDRANELIEELIDKKETPKIKLVSTPPLLPVAEKIAEFWKAVGIETSVQVSSVIPDEYQSFLATFDIPKDPDQYSFWHSTQKETNITSYGSPRIDKLLEDGRAELNIEDRKKIYLDFQRFLAEDSPAVFLYHPKNYNIIRK